MPDYTDKQSRASRHHEAAPTAKPLPGKYTLVDQAYAPASVVQRQSNDKVDSDARILASAARGVRTPVSPLPHRDGIQRAFGRYDVSSIQAHTGNDAASSASEMGATAYAVGNHVVLGKGADLFTEVHEAAHVMQQRSGVQLKNGVGRAGDGYEKHADEIAGAVVRGESAELLLDQFSGDGEGATKAQHDPPLQRGKPSHRDQRQELGSMSDAGAAAIQMQAQGESGTPLPGLEQPSKPEQDKLALTSTGHQQPAIDVASADQKKLADGLGKVTEALLKMDIPEIKRLTDLILMQAKDVPPAVIAGASLVTVSAALAGLVATKEESPVTTSPDIPLPDLGSVKLQAKVTYKGPANSPTEASITLKFVKGSFVVESSFKAAWADPGKPPSLDNGTKIEVGVSAGIPLGSLPKKKKEPTESDEMRSEAADLKQEEDKFRAKMTYKPGTPEAKAKAKEDEMQTRAIDALTLKPFSLGHSASPRPEGAWGSPQVLQSFDVMPGPGKQLWNLEQLIKTAGDALDASHGANLRVVAIFDPAQGDTEEVGKVNGIRQDTANANAYSVKNTLEARLPLAKGRIQTNVEFKGSGRTFELSAEAAASLDTREVSVIFLPRL